MSEPIFAPQFIPEETQSVEPAAQTGVVQKKEYAIAPVAEFPPNSHRVVKIGRREIGVFNVDGTFYALPNLCTHQLGPLCKGRVSGTVICSRDTEWKLQWGFDGEIVTCPWHGMEYHIKTGVCLAFPEIRLRAYEVWVEDEQVKIRV
jgi:nitrite reductase/ring-hydroxylating ferredoxin subunit